MWNLIIDTKDDGGIGLKNREINFSDENIDQFTKEQKLRMQIVSTCHGTSH